MSEPPEEGDVFDRLARRVLGLAPLARPRLPPRFAPLAPLTPAAERERWLELGPELEVEPELERAPEPELEAEPEPESEQPEAGPDAPPGSPSPDVPGAGSREPENP